LKSLANIGDLIFCHAIGSQYGWYLNQLALVVEREVHPIKENPANYEYGVYMFTYRDYQKVQSAEFDKGNVEIIAKNGGTNIDAGRVKELNNIKKLKSFAEHV